MPLLNLVANRIMLLPDNLVVVLVPLPDGLKNTPGCASTFHRNRRGETRCGFPSAKGGFETCMRWKVVSEERVASKLGQLRLSLMSSPSSKNTSVSAFQHVLLLKT